MENAPYMPNENCMDLVLSSRGPLNESSYKSRIPLAFHMRLLQKDIARASLAGIGAWSLLNVN